jgi:hypothetical protein
MTAFTELLQTQRWDDHRYYHHSLVNQSLHLLSAISFLVAYLLLFWDPAAAALVGWVVAMTSRQVGHFIFEPKGYDAVNHATHAYKEEIKVGYNLRRKTVLLSIWGLSPLAVYFEPTLFGFIRTWAGFAGFFRAIGQIWFVIGITGLVFRTVQLFFLRDVMTGIVWATKIVTDPFNDIKLYHKAPLLLLRGVLRDDEGDEPLAAGGQPSRGTATGSDARQSPNPRR